MTPRTIANPLPCISCGYDLLGLAEGAVCPECALPIANSIEGRIHPGRLRVIRSATRSLAWLISIKAPFTCAGLASFAAVFVLFGILSSVPPGELIAALLPIGALALAVVILEWLALFRLTSRAGVRGMSAARRSDIGFLHAGIIIQIIAAPIAALLGLAELWSGMAFALLAVLVGRFVQFLASMIVFARLARALRNARLAKWCVAMSFTIPLVMVFGSAIYGLGGLVAAGLLIATAIRVRSAVEREHKRRVRRAAVREEAPAPA